VVSADQTIGRPKIKMIDWYYSMAKGENLSGRENDIKANFRGFDMFL
jgi:hypothetical protein